MKSRGPLWAAKFLNAFCDTLIGKAFPKMSFLKFSLEKCLLVIISLVNPPYDNLKNRLFKPMQNMEQE
jgi:hypothetical protein